MRLLTPVSSYFTKRGTEVRGLVVAPVCPESGSKLPTGTIVRGTVRDIRKVGLGFVHESARVKLDFHNLDLPDGQTSTLRARLMSVDNARERVDREGSIRGIRATASLSHRFGSRLAFATLAHPFSLFPFLILQNVLFRFPNPEIDYAPGTELHLQLQDPVIFDKAACSATERALHPVESAELRGLVAGFPYWTYSKRQRKAMDPTNIVFLGSQKELDGAFHAAGWTGSQSLSMATGLRTMRAVAESRGYADAPMRTLLLGGAEPDISRQKALNTFTKRHHLRIWKQPEDWRGRTVWASAATRDVSAGFSLRPFGFTHQIQNEVDLERKKVVGDLMLTGCVDSVAYVSRPESMRFSENEHRKAIKTDSRVAVVALNSCEAPNHATVAGAENRQPPGMVRLVRRITLTARNHFIRNNIIWRAGEGAHFGFRAIRGWHRGRKQERKTYPVAMEEAALDLRESLSGDNSGGN